MWTMTHLFQPFALSMSLSKESYASFVVFFLATYTLLEVERWGGEDGQGMDEKRKL